MKTADLCDQFEEQLQVAQPLLRNFGGHVEFAGSIATLKVFEDNALIRKVLDEDGRGRVLVIDGAGSLRSALVGDRIAALAVAKGWSGLVIHGCIRDVEAMATMALGVRALASTPRRSSKREIGEAGVAVHFAGIDFVPGHWLYSDADGIVVSARQL